MSKPDQLCETTLVWHAAKDDMPYNEDVLLLCGGQLIKRWVTFGYHNGKHWVVEGNELLPPNANVIAWAHVVMPSLEDTLRMAP